MSSTPRPDKTFQYSESMKHFFFSDSEILPVIEIEHDRIRIGCWYITIDAFFELNRQWLDFRNVNRKLRIQG